MDEGFLLVENVLYQLCMEVNKYENTQNNVVINREQSRNKSAEKNAAVVQLFCFLCDFASPRRGGLQNGQKFASPSQNSILTQYL